MPRIRKMLFDIIPKRPYQRVDPAEAVAMEASILAAKFNLHDDIQERIDDPQQTDEHQASFQQRLADRRVGRGVSP